MGIRLWNQPCDDRDNFPAATLQNQMDLFLFWHLDCGSRIAFTHTLAPLRWYLNEPKAAPFYYWLFPIWGNGRIPSTNTKIYTVFTISAEKREENENDGNIFQFVNKAGGARWRLRDMAGGWFLKGFYPAGIQMGDVDKSLQKRKALFWHWIFYATLRS